MKIRNLLIGFVLSILVLCASVPVNATKAAGCPPLPYKTYYTDASMTVECGWLDVCYALQSGCQTPYVKSVRLPCPCQ